MITKRLTELSENTLKYLASGGGKDVQRNLKIMYINRNRKVCFVPLYEFEIERQKIHSCILPDEAFILGIFDQFNKLLKLDETKLHYHLGLKEVYLYGKEPHDLDWLYEGDFRQKDSFFYIVYN